MISEDTRKKLRLAHLGKPKSVAHRENIRKARTGQRASSELRLKLREAHLGKPAHPNTVAALRKATVGVPRSATVREKIRQGHLARRPTGWCDRTIIEYSIRFTYEYYQWRSAVLHRDEHRCQDCGSQQELHAHHIKPFHNIITEYNITTLNSAKNCAELWDLYNGITLCSRCHYNRHKKKQC